MDALHSPSASSPLECALQRTVARGVAIGRGDGGVGFIGALHHSPQGAPTSRAVPRRASCGSERDRTRSSHMSLDVLGEPPHADASRPPSRECTRGSWSRTPSRGRIRRVAEQRSAAGHRVPRAVGLQNGVDVAGPAIPARGRARVEALDVREPWSIGTRPSERAPRARSRPWTNPGRRPAGRARLVAASLRARTVFTGNAGCERALDQHPSRASCSRAGEHQERTSGPTARGARRIADDRAGARKRIFMTPAVRAGSGRPRAASPPSEAAGSRREASASRRV